MTSHRIPRAPRHRHLLALSCALVLAGTALLGACSRSGSASAPRQTPEQIMAAQVEALKQENEALRAEQQDSARQMEVVSKQLASDREEQKKFKQMMSTNFDLLEQSVSLTLAKSTEKPAADKTVQDKPLLDTGKSDLNKPGPGAPGAASKGTAARATPANEPVGGKDAGVIASALSKALPAAAGKTAAKPGDKTAAKPAVTVTPAGGAADKEAALNDPDLQPPKHPKQLTANRAAKPLYERGFTLFGNGQYEQAILVYQNFLSRYPQDIYSDNAQFWIGESYLQLNKLDDAEAAYRKVLREYEHKSTLDGYKTPDAIYRLGTLFAKRHRGKRARQYMEVVAQRFPDSSAGRKAQRELQGEGPLAQAGDLNAARGG